MTKHFANGTVLLYLFATAAVAAIPQIRLTPGEIDRQAAASAGTGTSGLAGINTTVLAGDPTKAGLYTIRLSVPAHTKIPAHTHRDDRTTMVVSGTWYFGYGPVASDDAKKALPAGSIYSEPAGVAHFAETKDEAVVVYVTGFGPSDTTYVNPADDPRKN